MSSQKATSLAALSGLAGITDYQATVGSILQKTTLDSATVQVFDLATVIAAIGNFPGLLSARLQTIAAEAAVRGDAACVAAIVGHPNFDAAAEAALVTGALGAGGQVSVADM